MEIKKKFDFKKIGEGITEKARSGIETAKGGAVKAKEAVTSSAESFIQSIDKTGDGKFDLEDVAEIKRQFQEKQRQAKLKRDLDALNPIFSDNLTDGDFFLPKMLQLAEMDKKHASNPICEGSIGHEMLVKDLRIVTVYRDQTSHWGLRFYPDENQDFYYVDPVNPQLYIAIDYFFDYLRQARIGELQRIAQDLGASYFKVTIKERKKTLYKKSESAKISTKLEKGKEKEKKKEKETVGIQADHTSSSDEMLEGEIAVQASFEGHAPKQPQLNYYKNEPQINDLIQMRLHQENAIRDQHLFLQCAHSSGITEKTAASIDAAFTAMKCTGNTSFTSEAQNETRQIFQYDIVF